MKTNETETNERNKKMKFISKFLGLAAMMFAATGLWAAGVAKIGGTEYATLQAAFNAVQSGETIQLLVQKLAVADYVGTDKVGGVYVNPYGNYTEISAFGEHVKGKAMPATALANVVLRRALIGVEVSGFRYPQLPENVTIVGAQGGTELGSLDFSGSSGITVRNLRFNAANAVLAAANYGQDADGTTVSKEGFVGVVPKIMDSEISGVVTPFKDRLPESGKVIHLSNVIDASYCGFGPGAPDPTNTAGHYNTLDGCVFFGAQLLSNALVYYFELNASGTAGGGCHNWTVKNCQFTGKAYAYVYYSSCKSTDNDIVVINNTFGDGANSAFAYAFSTTSSYGRYTVTNNFVNAEFCDHVFSWGLSANQSDFATFTTLLAKDNTFINTGSIGDIFNLKQANYLISVNEVELATDVEGTDKRHELTSDDHAAVLNTLKTNNYGVGTEVEKTKSAKDKMTIDFDSTYHPVAKVGTTAFDTLADALNAAKTAGKVCELLCDITLEGEWTPIEKFAGTFDGKGHTISGLKVTGEGDLGLFAAINEGCVRNLTIVGAHIQSTKENAQQIGVLAGQAYLHFDGQNISNVTVTGATIDSKGKYVGGIIGLSDTEIYDSKVLDSQITGNYQVGGAVGFVRCGCIDGCTVTGNDVTALDKVAGGLAGRISFTYGKDTSMWVSGNVISGTATAPDVAGGVAGQLLGDHGDYAIQNNSINVTFGETPKSSPIAVLYSNELGEAFTSKLAANITGNWWEDETLSSDSYTYTAAETGAGDQVVYRGAARIGTTVFKTLEGAIDAADVNAEIVLLGDVTDFPGRVIDKSLTIDLNGHTVVGKNEKNDATSHRMFKVTGTADMTIKNGTLDSPAALFGSMRFESTGKLTMTDLTLKNCRDGGLNIKLISKGTAVLERLNIIATMGGGIEVNKGTAEVRDCVITQTGSAGEEDSACTALAVAYGGRMTVDGGTYSGVYGASIFTTGGWFTFNSGSLSGSEHMLVGYAASDTPEDVETSFTLVNGKFAGDVQKYNETATYPVIIKTLGGIYSIDPTPYLAEGMHVSANTDETTKAAYPYAIVVENFYKDKSDENLWHVRNLTGLKEFRDSVNEGTSYAGKTIQIDSDIIMTEEWAPIIAYNGPSHSDKLGGATIDGKNHKIVGMTVNVPVPEKGYVYGSGFIGNVNGGITIKDLAFENAKVTSENGSQVGIVVGMSYGRVTMENVDLKDCVVTGMTKTGLYIGQNDESTTTLRNCDVVKSQAKANYSSALLVGLLNINSLGAALQGNTVDDDSKFVWIEGEEGHGVQINGRYYSVDDVNHNLWLTDPGEKCLAEKRVDGATIKYQGTTYGAKGTVFYPEIDFVAEIAGMKYATVADAMKAAKLGDTVNLLATTTEAVVLPRGVMLVENGYGHGAITTTGGLAVMQVEPGVYVSSIPVVYAGETPYPSLESALNMANNGDYVTPVADLVVENDFTVPDKDLTIDLNGTIIEVAANKKLTFGKGTTSFVDQIGGGALIGAFVVPTEGCQLVLNAGTYSQDPTDYIPAGKIAKTNPDGTWTVGVQEVHGIKEVDTITTNMTDEAGQPITDPETAEKAKQAVEDLKDDVVNSLGNASVAGANTGISDVVKESENAMVKALEDVATEQGLTEDAKTQIKANISDLVNDDGSGTGKSSSNFVAIAVAEISSKVDTSTQKMTASPSSIVFTVVPVIETVVTNTVAGQGTTTNVISAVIPNETIKEMADKGHPTSFTLPIYDQKASTAIVRHISDQPDKYPTETFTCEVKGPAGDRYIDISVSHFSDFEVKTTRDVYVDTAEEIGIFMLDKMDAGEVAFGVPFTKSGVTGEQDVSLDELVVAGKQTGDKCNTWTPGGTDTNEYAEVDADTVLATGKALWYTRGGDSSVPLTLAGFVKTGIVSAGAAASSATDRVGMSNFVNPYRVEVDLLTKLQVYPAEGDQIVVEGSATRYFFNDGYWKKRVKGNQIVPDPKVSSDSNRLVYGAQNMEVVTTIPVPAGKTFWYVSKETVQTVEW